MSDLESKIQIKPMTKDNKTYYHVVMPNGRIANNHDHVSREIAENHKRMLEAFGYDKK
jgi:hypothetical protein